MKKLIVMIMMVCAFAFTAYADACTGSTISGYVEEFPVYLWNDTDSAIDDDVVTLTSYSRNESPTTVVQTKEPHLSQADYIFTVPFCGSHTVVVSVPANKPGAGWINGTYSAQFKGHTGQFHGTASFIWWLEPTF